MRRRTTEAEPELGEQCGQIGGPRRRGCSDGLFGPERRSLARHADGPNLHHQWLSGHPSHIAGSGGETPGAHGLSKQVGRHLVRHVRRRGGSAVRREADLHFEDQRSARQQRPADSRRPGRRHLVLAGERLIPLGRQFLPELLRGRRAVVPKHPMPAGGQPGRHSGRHRLGPRPHS